MNQTSLPSELIEQLLKWTPSGPDSQAVGSSTKWRRPRGTTDGAGRSMSLAGRWFDQQSCSSDAALYEESRQTLEKMVVLRGRAELLLKTLNDEIAQIRDAVVPAARERGFHALPDELLVYVLDFVADSFDWHRSGHWKLIEPQMSNLALTSKRIYTCARSAQKVRALCDLRKNGRVYSESFGEDVLADGGESHFNITTLVLEWTLDVEPSDAARVLAALPHLKRLSLGLSFANLARDEEPPTAGRVVLPRLESLNICIEGWIRKSAWDGAWDGFSLNWFDLPRLKYIRIGHICPGQPISSCEVDKYVIACMGIGPRPPYGRVRAHPTVTHLALINFESSNEMVEAHTHTVDLAALLPAFPNVSNLHLKDCQWCLYKLPTEAAEDRLHAPQLRQLHFSSRDFSRRTHGRHVASSKIIAALEEAEEWLRLPQLEVYVYGRSDLAESVRQVLPSAR